MSDNQYLQRIGRAIEKSRDAILILNEDGEPAYINERFTSVLGYELDDLRNTDFEDFLEEDFIVDEITEALRDGSTWQGSIFAKIQDDEAAEVNILADTVRNAERDHVGYIFFLTPLDSDLDELMSQQAYYDPLTDLPTRALFTDRLKQALARSRRNDESLSLMCLDLDEFRAINDAMGVSVGDKVLQEVADRLRETLREEDSIGRMNGDRFMLLLPSTNSEGVSRVAQKVMDKLNQLFVIEENEFFITISMGVTIFPDDGNDAEDLYQKAERAMFQAKQEGGDSYLYYGPSMQEEQDYDPAIIKKLREALTNNGLDVYYQPRFESSTQEVVGAEALVRWHTEDLGTISPAKFIPMAEQTGMITEIDRWVLHTALKQMQEWEDEYGQDLTVSVNISRRDLSQDNLEEIVSSAISESGIDPGRVELEITERMATDIWQEDSQDVDLFQKFIQDGMQISIDDFGTGYSSLQSLTRIPAHTLKIDRSFLKNIPEDRENFAIIQTIVELARNLNMNVVAEGVEEERQLNELSKLDVQEIQGYLFAFGKPLKANIFEELISKQDEE